MLIRADPDLKHCPHCIAGVWRALWLTVLSGLRVIGSRTKPCWYFFTFCTWWAYIKDKLISKAAEPVPFLTGLRTKCITPEP